MIKNTLTGLLILFSFTLNAQILTPASWKVVPSTTSPTVGDTFQIAFNATIDPEWYVYSNDFDPDLGPMLTEIIFNEQEGLLLIGEPVAVNPQKKYDEIWGGEVTYFKKKGVFVQQLVLTQAITELSGEYAYQVCSDVTGQCIPSGDEFSVSLTPVARTSAQTSSNTPKPKAENRREQDASAADSEPVIEDTTATQSVDSVSAGSDTNPAQPKKYALSTDEEKERSLFGFFIVAFLAGLAALLTPCVFPMIPLTVTFFTNDGGSRTKAISKAIVYGLSIIGVYTLSGTLVAVLIGPEFANWLATHWVPNILFFLIFLFFALSFLGLFEINLPSWLVNSTDRQADKGGYYGVVFMAITLVLVSFSCTGPLVGSILVESARGEFLKPVIGMLGFSIAFAVPFTLFAIFPETLKSLPKSGGWLNSVKVVLGFLELALALKFLSIADQVYHWRLLDREIFLTIWIVIFTLLGLYLLGKIQMPGDSKVEKLPVMRLMFAIVAFSFSLYLIPGLFGSPLKGLSGYLPPITTQDFILTGNAAAMPNENQAVCDVDPRFNELFEIPYGIKGYFDYDEALACARELNKPLFIDFTGHGCVNCREMEARVWSDPEVLRRLKEDYVVVALYVDDKTVLPEEEWYTSAYDNKVKKSIGKQNADFQIRIYENNAQPFYVLLDNNEELLQNPKAYDLNVGNFVEFLDNGLKEFQQSNR